jgi:hypothetical protein
MYPSTQIEERKERRQGRDMGAGINERIEGR